MTSPLEMTMAWHQWTAPDTDAFATRAAARQGRLPLEAWLLQCPPDSLVQVDLRPVRLLDTSTADELVALTVARLLRDEYPVHLVAWRLQAQHGSNIAVALERRRLAAWVQRPEEPWAVIGWLEPILAATLAQIRGPAAITSRTLVTRTGMDLAHASDRLRLLWERRLLCRQRLVRPMGGAEFVYTRPPWDEGGDDDGG